MENKNNQGGQGNNQDNQNKGNNNQGGQQGNQGVNWDDQNKGGNAGGRNNNDNGSNKSKEPEGKMYTQAQIDQMLASAKGQGQSELAKQLGLDPNDAKAQALVKAVLDSQKTDEQKALEQQQAQNTELEALKLKALTAEVKAESMVAEVKPEHADDITTLVMSKLAASDGKGDTKTIVGEFKSKYPAWFKDGSNEEDDKTKDKNAGQRGTGSTPRTGGQNNQGNDDKGLGARLAAQRRGTNQNKSSFWGQSK